LFTNQCPLLSVIIPVYNVELYLKRCLDSVLSQTYSNLEIIIVNDGSTDGSSKICNSYANIDSRIQVIHKINGGVSSTRNTGIDMARGEWICFIDSDDWIEPNMYEKLMEAVINSKLLMVSCGYVEYHADGVCKTIIYPEFARSILTKDILDFFVWKDNFIHICSMIIHRGLVEPGINGCKLRFKDDLFQGEDSLFIVETMMLIKDFIYIPDALYHYCWRENSAINTAIFTPIKLSKIAVWDYMSRVIAPLSINLMWKMRFHSTEIAINLINPAIRSGHLECLPIIKKASRKYFFRYLLHHEKGLKQKLRHTIYATFPKIAYKIDSVIMKFVKKTN